MKKAVAYYVERFGFKAPKPLKVERITQQQFNEFSQYIYVSASMLEDTTKHKVLESSARAWEGYNEHKDEGEKQ